MGGQYEHLASECLDNELEAGGFNCLDALLNHVVAILVLDTFEHIAVKFLDDQLLLIQRDGFEGLLDHPAAVHLESQWLDVRPQLTDQLRLLLGSAELEELLDHVVAEDIGHQLVGGHQDLLEDELLLSRGGTLQLLLNKPGAVLVLAEFHDVICKISQLEVGIAIIPAIISVYQRTELGTVVLFCPQTEYARKFNPRAGLS